MNGPKVIAEIGSDKLGSFYCWIKCNPTIKKAIAIEIRGTPCVELFERAFPNVQFLFLPKSSRDPEAVKSIMDFLGDDAMDVVFLDGEKSQFIADFDLYCPLVREGGLIFMHDIYPCGPNDPTVAAWKHIKKMGYKTSEIIDFSEVDAEIEREKAGEPPKTSHAGWVRHWKKSSCGVGVVHK